MFEDRLSLTFDDGPDELGTPGVLSALRRSEVRATFFMIGERAQGAPSLVRSVLAAGHEVQLHCHRHVRHTELSEAEIELDTSAALEALSALGVRPTHWRTPWGVQTPATTSIARRRGLKLVGWTCDTHDWRGDPSSSMLTRARPHIAGGGIVLMHDGLGPGAQRTTCENTIELLPPLIALARASGLDVGPLEEDAALEFDAIPDPAPTPDPAPDRGATRL
jgi:peptidoglycan/xylan/chitin deacetylase (PgdA/CDA1 family)